MATRILAVLNQKGGVGKTTTCVNLGAALARRGLRVLLVDMDPQANLTVHLGLEPPQLQRTTYSLLIGQHGLAEAVQKTGVPGLFVVPSTLALANAEIQLASTVGRELVLREALEEWLNPSPEGVDALAAAIAGSAVSSDSAPADSPSESTAGASGPAADFVLIDCPPSLGTLTMNALCAAGEVLLPIQTEFFALQGVAGILESVRAVQRLNKGLRLSLVVPSLVDRRTTLARDVLDEVRGYFGDIVTKTEIRKNIKLAEAPSHGKTIFEWEPRCNGALDYESLAAEVLGERAPEPDAQPAVVDEVPDEPDDAEPEVAPPEGNAPGSAVAVAAGLFEAGLLEAGSEPIDAASESGSAPAEPADDELADAELADAELADDGLPDDGLADAHEDEASLPRSSGIGLAPDYVDSGSSGASQVEQVPRVSPPPVVHAAPEQREPASQSAAPERFPAVVRESLPAAGSDPAAHEIAETEHAPAEAEHVPAEAEHAPAEAGTHTAAAPRVSESRASWWQSLRRNALRRDTPGS